MRLYNIRSGELEVTLNSNQAIKPSIAQQPPGKKRAISSWSSRLMLFTGGVLVVGNIPVYSSVHHSLEAPDTTSTYITQNLKLPKIPEATFSGYEQEIEDSTLTLEKGEWRSYTLKDKDNFSRALGNIKLSALNKEISKNEDISKVVSKVKKGESLLFYKSGNEITQLIYINDKKESFLVSRIGDGFKGEWASDRISVNEIATPFTVKTSLPSDAAKANIPNRIINRIANIFRKDVNFKNIHRGDKFVVVYEGIDFDGEQISSRNILAATYESKSKLFQRVRYTLDSGKTYYLSANGNDSQIRKVAFDRRPVRGRLSSHFNPRRKHPIFRTIRAHNGTDYAAPRGTPIRATGDGVVRFRGRNGGYGKVVELKHSGGITTRYGHMSRYKKGVTVGKRVKRGDIIGYVGSTGNSTGNHVHYEYRVRGKPANPERVKLPTIGLISKSEQKRFKMLAKTYVKTMNEAKLVARTRAQSPSDYGG